MKISRQVNGLALATAAAALFVLAPMSVSADEHAAKGRCIGGNACKGQGACAGENHACAGQNACKGQGYTQVSKEECEKAGGTYEEPKAE